jgi:hypothetical protein
MERGEVRSNTSLNHDDAPAVKNCLKPTKKPFASFWEGCEALQHAQRFPG